MPPAGGGGIETAEPTLAKTALINRGTPCNGLRQRLVEANVMTTSSDNKTPAATRPEAKNWHELSDRFAATETEKLAAWLDVQLIVLEESQKRFISRRSLVKSLRRS